MGNGQIIIPQEKNKNNATKHLNSYFRREIQLIKFVSNQQYSFNRCKYISFQQTVRLFCLKLAEVSNNFNLTFVI